jgi:GNAT superfamily N-acetyltransferase
MEYRKANLSDLDKLAQLRVEMLCEDGAYSETFRAHIFNNTKQFISDGILDESFVSWAAVQGTQIIAMGGVSFLSLPPNDWCPGGKTAYIGNVYTVPAFRKQGIASCLLEHMISEAKNRGCERILLNTTDIGRPLYEKYGFEASPTAMALYPFGITPIL